MSGVATLGCARCRSTRLTLTEVYEEFHIFDSGELVLVDGAVCPTGIGIREPGEVLPKRSWITCQDCEHGWHPRRPVGTVYDADVAR